MSDLQAAFLVIGGVGFVIFLLSFVLGGLLDIDFVDTDGDGPSLFSMQVLLSAMVGLGLFGGLVAYQFGVPESGSLVLAVAGFFGVGLAMHRFVLVPLKRLESNSIISRSSYEGLPAKVVLAILPARGGGQVRFTDPNGAVVTESAEAEEEIPTGTQVLIYQVKDNSVVVMRDPSSPASAE